MTFNPETCDLCVHVKLRNVFEYIQMDPLTVQVLLSHLLSFR